MAVDTPARIAIVGAGPVGIEAALYARYLGYEVLLFEQGVLGAQFQQAAEMILPTNARENRTPLGLAALQAQDPAYEVAVETTAETARQWWENYLQPLTQTDLLVDCIHPGQTVLRIERSLLTPEERLAAQSDQEQEEEYEDLEEEKVGEYEDNELCEEEQVDLDPFELLVRQTDGTEQTVRAEVVIDATGKQPVKFQLPAAVQSQPRSSNASGTSVPASALAGCMTAEPNFYFLGSKACCQTSDFLISTGHHQIRELFALLGDRPSLNLYGTFKLA